MSEIMINFPIAYLAGNSQLNVIKNIAIKIQKRSPALFYAALALYCTGARLDWLSINNQVNIQISISVLYVLTILLLILKCCSDSYSLQEIVLGGALFLLSIISHAFSNSFMVLWLTIFIFSAKHTTLRNTALVVLIVSALGTMLTILGSMSGFLKDNNLSRHGQFTRYSLGFSHVNGFGQSMLSISSAWLTIMYSNKNRVLKYLPPVLGILITFVVSNSRTAIAGILCMVVLSALAEQPSTKFRCRITNFMAALAVILAIASLTIAVTFSWNSSALVKLNDFLSGRLVLWNHYINEFGVSLFGVNPDSSSPIVVYGVEETFLLDGSYLRLIVQYGAIVSLCFLCSIFGLMRHLARVSPLGPLSIGIGIYLICGIVENNLINLQSNFYLIGLSLLLFKESTVQKYERQTWGGVEIRYD